MTISLCMIVKNEEAVLKRCLDSLYSVADEIIIVDTGSNDNTKNIAKQYTDKIFDFEWIDDFSAARNFAFSKAVMDYQMWIDADDILPEDQLKPFVDLKKSLTPDIDMVTMKYHTSLDESGNPLVISTRERLLKRENNYKWQEAVHECIPLSGNILNSDIHITHLKPKSNVPSVRNLKIYEGIENTGNKMTPRQLYYFARELMDHQMWAKAVYYFERFLETNLGWYEDIICTCYNLSICYKYLHENEKILPILFKSFLYDTPRAEICCAIGYYYMNFKEYDKALRWFQTALEVTSSSSLGFVMQDYSGYIPNIESCVCCCALKQYDKANKYNEAAGKLKPDSLAVKQNRDFLSKFLLN